VERRNDRRRRGLEGPSSSYRSSSPSSVPAVFVVELRGLIFRIDVQNITMTWVGLVLVYEAVCREKSLQLRLRTAKQK
jgi:hypothetical protein